MNIPLISIFHDTVITYRRYGGRGVAGVATVGGAARVAQVGQVHGRPELQVSHLPTPS